MVRLRVRGRYIPLDRPLLMAVLNVNNDSFSDPGPRSMDTLVGRAVEFAADGATIIDIGAQSSVTQRAPVSAAIEAAAIAPVIREISRALPDVLISVDTFKAEVAQAALREGAHIINDVSGLRDHRLAQLCAQHNAALVVMQPGQRPTRCAPPEYQPTPPRARRPRRLRHRSAASTPHRPARFAANDVRSTPAAAPPSAVSPTPRRPRFDAW